MMKIFIQFLRGVLLLALVLTSCSLPGSPTQLPLPPPAQITETNSAVATATDVPFELVSIEIHDPVVGTTMRWVDGSVLVYVPEGGFLMGGDKNDNPEHNITLSSFWIYQTKVTNRMYGLCIEVGVCTPPLDKQAVTDLQNHYLLDRPIIDVNWEQAQAYCGWVEGRLPTEAQWEKAARGPDGNIYPWGTGEPSCGLLNFYNCLGKTSRVFDYLNGRSFYSAYDMAGNTFEWVNDWYDPDYYPNGPDIDPPGPNSGSLRVVRGSSFLSRKADTPVSLRSFAAPDDHKSDLDFRCVVEKPRVFAPYCQTSAFVPGDANVPPPSRSCDVSEREVGRGCGFVNHDIEGAGEIMIVEDEPPLVCENAGAPNRIFCSGPPGTTAVIVVAVVCGTINRGDIPADPECLEDFEPVPGSEVSCEFIPGPSAPTECTEVEREDGTTDCVRLMEDLPDIIAPPCRLGEYRTDDGMCVGTIPEGGLEPGNSCIEGFTYDTALGCCQSPSGVYPSCGADEYYDTVHGCQPRPDASGGILTLITFSVTTGGGCGGGVPGGDDPGDDDPGDDDPGGT